jgi:uncharacterized protein with NRDE domain
MCLILFANGAHPRYRLVVAANRDEWFRRPSAQAAFWEDQPNVLAGRDLEQGGTWLGVTRSGRFSALTNFRDPASKRDRAPSRGALVTGFLTGTREPLDYAAMLTATADAYNGFNLLAGDGERLAYVSSRRTQPEQVAPGVHGLSNGLLDESWPKVRKGREGLARLLSRDLVAEDLFGLLKNESLAPEEELPSTGVSREWERLLSAMHIVADGYGTRCATVVLIDTDGVADFRERTFDASGRPVAEVTHRFSISAAR